MTESKPQVTPYEVNAGADGVDYDRLIHEFGTTPISQDLIDRVERLTGKPAHPFLKRGLFFSHRSLEEILDAYEKGEKFYLYTGRGPSSEALHLGHMIPFVFTKYLQEAFDVPLVIQLTDDEKFLFKDLTLEECTRLGVENAKDIIALGFDPQKTFIFLDTEYMQFLYPTVCKIEKTLTANQVRAIFGFNNSDNVGKYMYPAVQAAPSFSSVFPHIFGERSNVACLIPCAIDQDPFFRMTRDIAPKLGLKKPAVIHSKFFPALKGLYTKMSASLENSAIFMTDTPTQIKNKINRHAFSGGCNTAEEHRKYGADLRVDIPYQYLRVFDEDDAHVEKLAQEYGSGRMLTGEFKKEVIQVLTQFVVKHQEARKNVTTEMVREYMTIRKMY